MTLTKCLYIGFGLIMFWVIVQSINRLSTKVEDVQDVVSAVNDLAEQSNLLSVNASTEAAKAGAYGKGFDVVAQEVKNLAAWIR